VNTINQPLDRMNMHVVADTLRAQRKQGEKTNSAEQEQIVETVVMHAADMQFRGQTHLIRIGIPSPDVTREELQRLFEEAYFRRFQVRLPEVRAVLVNLVTSVVGRRQSLSVATLGGDAPDAGSQQGTRSLYSDGAWREAHVVARHRLKPGDEIAGPAIVQQLDATTAIERGAVATVDAFGNLRIMVGKAP
jgi:N-methylhydantoinase A